MQRMGPQAVPPNPQGGLGKQNNANQQPAQQQSSPALLLARRISREQGRDQARKFLMAMEPFLAPYERQSIAEQINVTLPKPAQQPRQEPNRASYEQAPHQPTSSYTPPQQQQNSSYVPPRQEPVYPPPPQQPNANQYAPPPPPRQQNNGMNPQLLMQLLSQMNPGAANNLRNMGGMNPAMLSQLFGQMNQR